jgi:hypothetical protein
MSIHTRTFVSFHSLWQELSEGRTGTAEEHLKYLAMAFAGLGLIAGLAIFVQVD